MKKIIFILLLISSYVYGDEKVSIIEHLYEYQPSYFISPCLEKQSKILEQIFSKELYSLIIKSCSPIDFRTGNGSIEYYDRKLGYKKPTWIDIHLDPDDRNVVILKPKGNTKEPEDGKPDYMYYQNYSPFYLKYFFKKEDGVLKIDDMKIFGVDQEGDEVSDKTDPNSYDLKKRLSHEKNR